MMLLLAIIGIVIGHHKLKIEGMHEGMIQVWICDCTNPMFASSAKQVSKVAHRKAMRKSVLSLYNRSLKVKITSMLN